jgi:CRISPR-associated endonuclease/helicase Cas3
MKRLTAADFPEFFRELHSGRTPFPWQIRLAERVCGGNVDRPWPRQIALPTASGKTACIDIALFSLACAASAPVVDRLAAPRRIFFVVDRRVIVDQTIERARAIQRELMKSSSGIVRAVADNLRDVARGPHNENPLPLECFELRGGVYRDDGWGRSPTQPVVVCSTVDQIGSRLLFRGYGRSSKVWPVHAGLIGSDSLILLDEAHCSLPFAETIEAVGELRGAKWTDTSLNTPFSVSVMSATLRYNEQDRFVLRDDDYADEQLGPRLLSYKRAKLAGEIKAKTATPAFAAALVKEARLLADRGAKRIAVMVNRVRTAKLVFDLLADVPTDRRELFIGRMRPLDSQRMTNAWNGRLRADRGRQGLTEPVYIVSTQCLEVGADYDFDGLVCECASLDALRQRCGRLCRLGLGKCWATIVISAEDAAGKADDPIYGTALSNTWEWLRGQAELDKDDNEHYVNMGAAAIDKRLLSVSDEDLGRLVSAARHAPVLLPSHIDCWVQTSPVPEPSPDVSLFLHGKQECVAEVEVCWRADLDVDPGTPKDVREDRWIELLSLCPPTSAECMAVPLWMVRRWLTGDDAKGQLLTDIDGVGIDDDPSQGEPLVLPALRWCGPDDDNTGLISKPGEMRPGDTIVVPSAIGGWNELGHIPGIDPKAPPTDLGDEANFIARNRPVLRVYAGAERFWRIGAESLDSQAFKEAVASLQEMLKMGDLVELFSDSEWRDQIRDRLRQLSKVDGLPSWLRRVAVALCSDVKRRNTFHRHPSASLLRAEAGGGLVLVGRRRYGSSADTFTGEDETSTSTVEVPLTDHLSGVAKTAYAFAVRCGLPPVLQSSLKIAGQLHDLGKLDPRFQAWLHSGSAAEAVAAPEPLAKSSGRDDRKSREEARRRSGYPRGGRHELLSVQLAMKHGLPAEQDLDRDLVLHLIGSHHGHCRPFAPYVPDEHAPGICATCNDLSFALSEAERQAWNPARLDSGIAERFWRLVRRYGWWGLAWLESIFILADWRQSEHEMEGDADAAECDAE